MLLGHELFSEDYGAGRKEVEAALLVELKQAQRGLPCSNVWQLLGFNADSGRTEGQDSELAWPVVSWQIWF